MDPESNILEQLTVAEQILTANDAVRDDGKLTREEAEDMAGLAVQLAELVEALNGWLMRGGYFPGTWGTRCVNVDAHAKARP